MMILLWAREVLDAAFLHDSETRLFLVTVVYVFIAGALYLGAWPYKIREIIVWMNNKSIRVTMLGWAFSATGLLILLYLLLTE